MGTQNLHDPDVLAKHHRPILMTRLPIWQEVSQHVIENEPMKLVKNFQHGLQVYYLKTPRCVDATSQFCGTMNHLDVGNNSEEALVTEVLKTLIIDGFLE